MTGLGRQRSDVVIRRFAQGRGGWYNLLLVMFAQRGFAPSA